MCPSCRTPALVAHLRPEKALFESMQHFRGARNGLLAVVNNNAGPSIEEANEPAVKRPKTGTAITAKIAHGLFHNQSRDFIKKAIEQLTACCPVVSRLKTDGDKETLEKRHKNFVHLYNAQLNSPNPLTLEQVVAEIHRREAARSAELQRNGKSNTIVEKLKNGEVSICKSYVYLLIN